MNSANMSKLVDLKYKGGYVECKCGWRHELGDGFNGYHIDNCPKCTPELRTWNQRKVIYWDKSRRELRADLGSNLYFQITGGICVRYEAHVSRVEYGSERHLNSL